MTRSTKRPGRSLKVTGLIVMIVGGVLAAGSLVAAIAGIGGSVIDTLTGPLYTAPTEVSVHLNHRHNQLLQLTGTTTGSGLGNTAGLVTITPDQVRVLDPAGAVIPTSQPSGTFTVTRDRSVFTSAVSFDVAATGDYRVAVSGPPGTGFVVGPDITASAKSSARWFAGFGFSVLLFLAGLVLLLMGFSRQRRSGPGGPGQPVIHYGSDQVSYAAGPVIQFGPPPPAGWAAGVPPPGMPPPHTPPPHTPPPHTPPPGWYPDPAGSGRARYFDGARWH